jgi:hypothetical protein
LSFILALALTAVVVLGVWRLTRRPTDRDGRADKEQK